MTWSSSLSSQPCPSGYPANCTVNTITLSSTGTYAGVVTITVTVTSSPVNVNGVLISPNAAKIDFECNNPFPSQGSNVVFVVFGFGAGLTASGSAGVVLNKNGGEISFAANNINYSFQWVGTVDCTSSSSSSKRAVASNYSTSANVVSTTYTDTAINNYLSGCGSTCNAFVAALGLIVDFCALNGWRINIVLFSFPVNQLTSITWDPCVGDCSTGTSPSMGALTAPLFWLTVCMVLAHLWWSWKHM